MANNSQEGFMRIGSFEREWEVDFTNRIVRRKSRSRWRRFCDWIGRRRFRLSEFHGYARGKEASSAGMPYPHILDSDAMSPVVGVPKKLKLANGWSIPDTDIAVIYGDGYVLIGNGGLLVKEGEDPLDAVDIKPGFFGVSLDVKKLLRKLRR